MEYSKLAALFGDIPWYDSEIFPGEYEIIYKDCDPVEFVAGKIAEDFEFAATMLEKAKWAADQIIQSGKFQVADD